MNIKKPAIIIPIILIFILFSYFVWKNYFKTASNSWIEVNNPIAAEEEAHLRMIDRDIQRIEDLNAIGRALVDYAAKVGNQYPKTDGIEKISDENSLIYKTLKDGEYLSKLYQDPVPDKYYYGYSSDGSRFDLNAILENQNDGRCAIKENLCVYTYGSEQAFMRTNERED